MLDSYYDSTVHYSCVSTNATGMEIQCARADRDSFGDEEVSEHKLIINDYSELYTSLMSLRNDGFKISTESGHCRIHCLTQECAFRMNNDRYIIAGLRLSGNEQNNMCIDFASKIPANMPLGKEVKKDLLKSVQYVIKKVWSDENISGVISLDGNFGPMKVGVIQEL
ncbi:hypothetical protein KC678_01985 [Candidatus Dojkabacteria bacterium]|uniref:Uncharacterized protein n=1 Tax=Candidatus Dojkabacteria bacterium TaxID=2099670 RepID=A0A955IAS0_9BACT|nr:hypothetical protein [Candidatus Dojkabacteria bacterium]